MGQTSLHNIYLSGIHLDLSKDERLANDMTATGKFCPSPTCKDMKNEMEKVSSEERYTCHYCGGVVEYDEKGNIQEVWFTGH